MCLVGSIITVMPTKTPQICCIPPPKIKYFPSSIISIYRNDGGEIVKGLKPRLIYLQVSIGIPFSATLTFISLILFCFKTKRNDSDARYPTSAPSKGIFETLCFYTDLWPLFKWINSSIISLNRPKVWFMLI